MEPESTKEERLREFLTRYFPDDAVQAREDIRTVRTVTESVPDGDESETLLVSLLTNSQRG